MTIVGGAEVVLGVEGGEKALGEVKSVVGKMKDFLPEPLKAVAGPLAGVVGAVAAVGGALYGVGRAFDEQFDKIRVGTGQTGASLEALKSTFKSTLADSVASVGDVGTAITDLNKLLDLTGQALKDRSEQFLNLARVTNTPIDELVKSGAKALQAFGATAKEQAPDLDVLFRASQKSGLSVTQLADTMSGAAPKFRAAGLGFTETAALVAQLSKNGLDASIVIPGLGKAMQTAAKLGQPTAQVFANTLTAIRKAPNDIAASQIAIDTFGKRAGPQLAGLIRQGKLAYEDFANTIRSGDTINKAAQDTEHFGEKFDRLKNRILVGLEPVASKVFEFIDHLIDGLPRVVAAVQPFINQARNFLAPIVAEVARYFRQDLIPAIRQAADEIMPKIQKAIGDLQASFEKNKPELIEFRDAIIKVAEFLLQQVLPALVTVAGFLVGFFAEALGFVIETVSFVVDAFDGWKLAIEAIPGVWDRATAAINGKIDDMLGWFRRLPGAVSDAVGDLGSTLYDAGRAVITGLIHGIESKLGDLGGALKDVGKFILDHKGPRAVDLVMLRPAGQAIMQGLRDGIEGSLPDLGRSLGRVNSTIGGGVGTTTTRAAGAGGFIMQSGAVQVTVSGATESNAGTIGRMIGDAAADALARRHAAIRASIA